MPLSLAFEPASKKYGILVAVASALITFLTYASVYAFRKPFTVSSYADAPSVFGIHYKDALVISQVLGYMFSKFYGIKFIAELQKFGRPKLILLLVLTAWAALFFFAVIPPPYNIICLFINGFPLGIIWGVIFSYVEGRKATDFIGASLAVSFIFSSGFVKSVAQWLSLHFAVTEWWLPFFTGLVFIVPLIFFLYLLHKIPPPSPEDIALRVQRPPMDKQQRRIFFNGFKPGLILLIITYVFLTIFRDIRDNFAADIWKETGYGGQPSIFTATEIPITILVLIVIAAMIIIRNNYRAFFITHLLIILGFLIAGISSWLFTQHSITAFNWMMFTGLGLYMGYIPFNCILFERMIAAFRTIGNVGFLMYLADSFGYLGSVGVILLKTFMHSDFNWSTIYSNGVVYLSITGIIFTLIALKYFNKKYTATQKV